MRLTTQVSDALIKMMHDEGAKAGVAKAEGRVSDQIFHHLRAHKIWRVVAKDQGASVRASPEERDEVVAFVRSYNATTDSYDVASVPGDAARRLGISLPPAA